ncbi:MAG: hypothetical protein R3F59_36275 [Myxococcota bacterium]
MAIDPAFLTSHVAFRQGVGWIAVPDFRYPGIPTGQFLNLGGITEALQGQLRIGRFAAYAQGSGAVLSGLNPSSAVFVGVRGTYELRAGGRVRLYRGERVQLTGRLGLRQAQGLGIIPADVAVAVLDDPQGALPEILEGRWLSSLLTVERATQAEVGVAGAVALGPAVGLQGSVSARMGRTSVTSAVLDVAGPSSQLGAGASVDVRPLPRMGLQFGLRDRLDRDLGVRDAIPERNRLLLTSQAYYDRGDLALGLVVTTATANRDGVREWELGLEGRAVACF